MGHGVAGLPTACFSIFVWPQIQVFTKVVEIRWSLYHNPVMKLTGTQIRHLRGLAHHKRTVVTVGLSGLTEGVINELDSVLTAHELAKIKLPAGSRLEKQTMLHQLCTSTTATSIQLIGRIGIIYRPGEPPLIPLPGITRSS